MEYAQMNPVMAGHLPFQQFGGVLPPGWLEYRTPTGQPYWYNTFTRQSSWQFPVAVPQPPPKKKQIKKKIPDTHWLFVLTPDGYEFYYDRETKTSVWEMPEELKEPMEKLRELEKQKQKEEEENKKKRMLEEEEAKETAKKIKLEQEKAKQEEIQETEEKTQEQVDTTEMTEDDIMWQLQQMEELSGEQIEEEEEQMTEQILQQQEEERQPIVSEEKEKEKEQALTEQECIDQFNEMLKEKNISPFATYTTELPKLMADPRFTMVKHNKQKALFNKYCKDLGEMIRQQKMNKKTPQEEFQELLETKVTVKMYWDDFRRKYKNDNRFQAMKSTKEKETLFKEYVRNHLDKKKSSTTDSYMALLRETKEIKRGIRWRDAKKILEKDDRYHAIDSKEKREDLFRDYLDGL